MAGAGVPPDEVHQIQFCWQDATNRLGEHRGYGPVAASIGGAELAAWTDRLAGSIRTEDSPPVRRPGFSQVYWSDGEYAAVLRRTRSQGEARDDVCHAVVGRATRLTVLEALCMDREWWHGLHDADRDVRCPVDLHLLRPVRPAVRERLDQRVRGLRNELVLLGAAVLPGPYEPVLIVDTQLDVEDRIALLWGFLDMTEIPTASRPWTFSTYEARQDAENAPHVLFLPYLPGRPTFEVRRHRVDLSAPAQSDELAAAARNWVEVYFASGGSSARDWLDHYRRTQPASERDADRAAVNTPNPRPSQSGQPTPAAPTPDPPQPPVVKITMSQNEPPPVLIDAMLTRGSEPAEEASRLIRLVNRLGKTGDPAEADSILEQIGVLGADAAARDRLRHRLFDVRFWEPELRTLFEVNRNPYAIDEVRRAVRALVRTAVGPDVGSPGADHQAALFIAQPDAPQLVLDELGLYAAAKGRPYAFDRGYAARWKRHHGLPAPTPTQHPVAADASPATNRWRVAAVILAAFLVLAVLALVISGFGGSDLNPPGAAVLTPRTSLSPDAGAPPVTGPTDQQPTAERYPGRVRAYQSTSLDLPAPSCNHPVYLEASGPAATSQPAHADLAYSGGCGGAGPSSYFLTGASGARLGEAITGFPCPLSQFAGFNEPPRAGQSLCVETADNWVVELFVASTGPDGSLSLQLTAWKPHA